MESRDDNSFDLSKELMRHHEGTMQDDLSRRIDDLSKDRISGDLPEILEAIQDLPSESERDFFVSRLVEKTGISKSAIQKDLKNIYKQERTIDNSEKVTILHPSYDSKEDFILLGFKEPVIANNKPEQQNVYLLAQEGTASIHYQPTMWMAE